MIDLFNNMLAALDRHGPLLVMVGVLLAVNGFFIWQTYHREQALQKQIDALQKHLHGIVVPLMTDSRETIARCTEVIEQNSQVILRLIRRD